MQNRKLYPILYMGINYTEETINDVFDAFYHSISCVRDDGGIYMFEGMVVYPDGSMIDESKEDY